LIVGVRDGIICIKLGSLNDSIEAKIEVLEFDADVERSLIIVFTSIEGVPRPASLLVYFIRSPLIRNAHIRTIPILMRGWIDESMI